MKKPLTNLDNLYCFATPRAGEETTSFVKILKGPLEGSVINIQRVGFEEVDENLKLNLDYEFVDEVDHDLTNDEILQIVGDIVVDILNTQSQ